MHQTLSVLSISILYIELYQDNLLPPLHYSLSAGPECRAGSMGGCGGCDTPPAIDPGHSVGKV